MTASAERLVIEALARVLDLDPAGLRSDTPLAALGVDSLARICLADALEEAGTVSVRVDDTALAAAATIADVAAAMGPVPAGGGSRS